MPRNDVPFLNWLIACTLAEALGIAVVAVTYAAVDRGLLTSANVWILSAGGWEGLCLGTAQAWLLRRLRVNPVFWVSLTVAGAVAGYGLSLLGGAGSGTDAATAAEPPVWLMALLGAGTGLGMGVAMGLIQSLALSWQLPRRKWILANAVGWMPAMAAIMIGAGLATQAWSLLHIAAAGAASGAVAGLCVGIATGVVVRSR